MKLYQSYENGPQVDLDSVQVIHEYYHQAEIPQSCISVKCAFQSDNTYLSLGSAFIAGGGMFARGSMRGQNPFDEEDYNCAFVIENIYKPFLEAWRNKDE